MLSKRLMTVFDMSRKNSRKILGRGWVGYIWKLTVLACKGLLYGAHKRFVVVCYLSVPGMC